jgi:hypothetical protein
MGLRGPIYLLFLLSRSFAFRVYSWCWPLPDLVPTFISLALIRHSCPPWHDFSLPLLLNQPLHSLLPQRWRQYDPLNCWYSPTMLQSVRNCEVKLCHNTLQKSLQFFILNHLFCEYPHPYLTHFWAQSRLRLHCSHKVCPVCVYPIYMNVAMLTCLVLPNIVAASYLWGPGFISWFRDLLFSQYFFLLFLRPQLVGWSVSCWQGVDSRTWILSESR